MYISARNVEELSIGNNAHQNIMLLPVHFVTKIFFAIELKKKGCIHLNGINFYILNYYVTIDWEDDRYTIKAIDTKEYSGIYDEDGGCVAEDGLSLPKDDKQIENVILQVFENMLRGIFVNLEGK